MSKLDSILRRPFYSRAVTLGILFTCVLVVALLFLTPLSGETQAKPQGTESQSASALPVEYAPRTRSSIQGLDVCGDITTDTTWATADSPIVVSCDTNIKTGVTLVLEAGVVVKLDENVDLTVGQSATLRAEGTVDSPIYFTSLKDDSVGGDTNGDGGATVPAKGDWRKIIVQGGEFSGTLIFGHVVVRYGGTKYEGMVSIAGDARIRNSTIEKSKSGGVFIDSGAKPTVLIENSIFRYNNRRALELDGASPTVRGNTFDNNGSYTMWIRNSSAIISSNTISGNGIYIDNSSPTINANTLSTDGTSYNGIRSINSTPELTDNTVSGYAYPVQVFDGYPQVVPTYSGNDFTDNQYSDVIGVGGTLTSGSWEVLGGYTHVLADDAALPSGVELTVPAGGVVKLDRNVDLTVEQNATLRAEGTVDSPTYFTSLKDDSVGGDTNGDGGATVPAKGDWNKIIVHSSEFPVIFDHVVVRYGGTNSYEGMVSIAGDAQIRNSVIEKSKGEGVFIGSTAKPTVLIENNIFRHNNSTALELVGASPAITDNTFNANGSYAIVLRNSSATISNNTISESGIYIDNSSPTIHANTLSRGGSSYNSTGIRSINSTPELTNNTVSGYAYPVQVFDGYPQIVPTYSGNNFSDNQFSDVIGVGGTLTSGNWGALGSYTHVLANEATLPSGVELTISAGGIVKLDRDLTVEQNATLRAEGTAESPIYFTSIKDDGVGGDTNGDGGASTPAPGNWRQVSVIGGNFPGSLIFNHVVVRYGGIERGSMLHIEGNASIQNSVIENSRQHGILIVSPSNSDVIIENNTFRYNDNAIRVVQ